MPPIDPLPARARGLWEELAAAPVSFARAGGVSVAVAPDSRMCPAGWVGVVTIGDAAIVTAPGEEAAAVRDAFAGLPVAALTDPDVVGEVLPVARTLGPAALAYVSGQDFRPVPSTAPQARQLPCGHAELRALEAACDADEADESGLAGITSPAFVVRRGGVVVAAAGYRRWPAGTAHVCVLTAPEWRGRGFARVTGSAAVSHALAEGLLPQWRARTPVSRRTALALGFRELGAQLSVLLG